MALAPEVSLPPDPSGTACLRSAWLGEWDHFL